MPRVARAARTPLPQRLYRAVSSEELAQIKRTGRFETARGSALGKYLWTNLPAAKAWAENFPGSSVVRANYDASVVKGFDVLGKVDGQQTAVFASEEQMNELLENVVEVS
jgi:hypothetical protein